MAELVVVVVVATLLMDLVVLPHLSGNLTDPLLFAVPLSLPFSKLFRLEGNWLFERLKMGEMPVLEVSVAISLDVTKSSVEAERFTVPIESLM